MSALALRPVRSPEDVLPIWRGTPVADLLAYNNLGSPHRRYTSAELLIGMCMDFRKALNIPDRFAFVMRAGGANLQRLEFQVAFAVAVGGVRTICLIGHDQCGMAGLSARREQFVTGLVETAGWDHAAAEAWFDQQAPQFEIHDPVRFVHTETERLRVRFPKVRVAPLMYDLESGLLSQVAEG